MPVVTRIEPGETFSEKAIPSDANLPFEVIGAVTAKAAVDAVKSEFGPQGTVHPDDSGGRLKSIQYDAVERIGASNDRGWIVFVRFSVDGSGANFEEPPVTEPTYVTAEYSTLERTIRAPYFYKRPVSYQVGGSLVQGFEWQDDVQEFVVSGLSLRIVVNVISTQYNLGAFFSALGQQNKLHRLPDGISSNKLWQYLGAQSSQVSADVWSVTHEWWHDPGNDAPPEPIGFPSPDDIVLAPAREPFEDYAKYVIPVPGPTLGGVLYIPQVDVYSPYVEDAAGYNALPGDPIGRVTAP